MAETARPARLAAARRLHGAAVGQLVEHYDDRRHCGHLLAHVETPWMNSRCLLPVPLSRVVRIGGGGYAD